jgi:hypothetical protein
MQVKSCLFVLLLLALPVAHADENDPPLDLIELLGEMENEDVDLDIAMSDIHAKTKEEGASPLEVKDDE